MLIANNWKEYRLLDAAEGKKLECWSEYLLIRPDPQVIWDTYQNKTLWSKANAIYHRSKQGGGEWEFIKLAKQWQISYDLHPASADENSKPLSRLVFNLKPFSFKHTGVFPEQAVNWDWSYEIIRKRAVKNLNTKVLNLFAYTGAASLAAAAAGAQVTHVDSSKGIVTWAKENSLSSALGDAGIRWIVDDCIKFVEREIRRGNKYDAIIMDPPSYGRGPKGEIWKIEESIFPLIKLCSNLLSDKPAFFLVNSYTTGLQPGVLSAMLKLALVKGQRTEITADEIGLPMDGSDIVLPCGASARAKYEL